MIRYKDIDSDSGVQAYEIDSDSITVQFKGGGLYYFTYKSAGRDHVERMKQLAEAGDGLNAFINTTVKKGYEWKR
ncbi:MULTISPECIES: hypothetical protein [unclassified Fusibacter]|uniref:hypothetical protein n=1 Tax=unclassified Fusibacter TaxID=2624464 RepID=UPI001012EFBF|nr:MULTISPECIES: hypothetical protein [unclassified Fusibacter]MCK8061153.1 hypothetical protein [Fusibacter sp. A2]NPE23310.1 hypothetical protein [Fusibacter sp. A1]RXV59352.1 hypothetical protein DWB64_15935 [Fusibacter sp. A1]